jgi:hypothetical protein
MLPPLPRCSRWGTPRSNLPHPYQPSPIPLSGRPAHRPFRGLLGVHSRCGLHTRAVTKFVTAIRGLQTFRHLHACPGCFRRERSPGGPCTHWKAPPCHGARGMRTLIVCCSASVLAEVRRPAVVCQPVQPIVMFIAATYDTRSIFRATPTRLTLDKKSRSGSRRIPAGVIS